MVEETEPSIQFASLLRVTTFFPSDERPGIAKTGGVTDARATTHRFLRSSRLGAYSLASAPVVRD